MNNTDSTNAMNAMSAAADDLIAESAPLPLPLDLLPVEALPLPALPDALRPWVIDVSERMQCPPDFVAVPMLVAAAALVARRLVVCPQGLTEWRESPNLWALVVGRPGMMKSPAMSAALAPIERLEVRSAEQFNADAKAHADALRLHKMRTDAADKLARQKLAKDPHAEIGNAFDGLEEPPAPTRPRLLVNDLTYEAMGQIMTENPDGLLCVRDEMRGLMATLQREDAADARAFYLQSWSGGRYTFDRITRGTLTVPSVRLSLVGCIQPGPLASFIRGASVGGSMDDGMVQRFLVCWPDQPGDWRNVDRHPDNAAKRAAFDVFERLHRLQAADLGAMQPADSNGDPEGSPFLRFAPDALELFNEWRTGLEKRLRLPDIDAATEGALSKFRKHVPALALTLHAINGHAGPVSRRAMVQALALADYFESHARRAYASGVRPVVAAAKALMRKVQAGALPAMFSARDVHQRGWSGLTDRDVVGAALDLLVAHRHLMEVDAGQVVKIGRPRTVYVVNPELMR